MTITPVDLHFIEDRLRVLEYSSFVNKYEQKKIALEGELVNFLRQTEGYGLHRANPHDVCRFLAWKDKGGKTKVHIPTCPQIGQRRPVCMCPKRLAAGTVRAIVTQLSSIFQSMSRGHNITRSRAGNVMTPGDNPAASFEVRRFVKAVSEEQAKGHSTINQAVPMFLDKLELISMYIDRQLQGIDTFPRQRYIFLRDQAFFKIQFFAGDRAGDLCQMLTQEIKIVEGLGIMISHTWGKTLRGGRSNTFLLQFCGKDVICPVRGVELYLAECENMGVNLRSGYLFRPVTRGGVVLDRAATYAVMYERLKFYLHTLGKYSGETPHSLRAGCAVSLALAGGSPESIMQHVGWRSREMLDRYARVPSLLDGSVSGSLARMEGSTAQESYHRFGNYVGLTHAFPN
jgi:hypothetical protein